MTQPWPMQHDDTRYLHGLYQVQGRDDVLGDHFGRDQRLQGHLLHLLTEPNQATDLLGLLRRHRKSSQMQARTHPPPVPLSTHKGQGAGEAPWSQCQV